MKKGLKVVLILVGISGILYLAYTFLLKPTEMNHPVNLTESFFTNLEDPNSCTDYFNSETISHCTEFKSIITNIDYTVSDIRYTNGVVIVDLVVGDQSDSFSVSFIRIEETGLRGILNNYSYKIDTIE